MIPNMNTIMTIIIALKIISKLKSTRGLLIEEFQMLNLHTCLTTQRFLLHRKNRKEVSSNLMCTLKVFWRPTIIDWTMKVVFHWVLFQKNCLMKLKKNRNFWVLVKFLQGKVIFHPERDIAEPIRTNFNLFRTILVRGNREVIEQEDQVFGRLLFHLKFQLQHILLINLFNKKFLWVKFMHRLLEPNQAQTLLHQIDRNTTVDKLMTITESLFLLPILVNQIKVSSFLKTLPETKIKEDKLLIMWHLTDPINQ